MSDSRIVAGEDSESDDEYEANTVQVTSSVAPSQAPPPMSSPEQQQATEESTQERPPAVSPSVAADSTEISSKTDESAEQHASEGVNARSVEASSAPPAEDDGRQAPQSGQESNTKAWGPWISSLSRDSLGVATGLLKRFGKKKEVPSDEESAKAEAFERAKAATAAKIQATQQQKEREEARRRAKEKARLEAEEQAAESRKERSRARQHARQVAAAESRLTLWEKKTRGVTQQMEQLLSVPAQEMERATQHLSLKAQALPQPHALLKQSNVHAMEAWDLWQHVDNQLKDVCDAWSPS